MSRIRTIKPEFWQHEELSALPEATHILAAALLNYADDEGFFNANPKLVKASCTPLREDSVSIHESLNLLSKIGFIKIGTGSDGKKYGHIITFLEHQRINRPTKSKIKEIKIKWDDSVNSHTQLNEESHPEGNGKEGNGKEGKRKGMEEGIFQMFPEWQPSDHIDRISAMAGAQAITKQDGYAESLGEFICYWLTKPDKRSQAEWDHKLIQSMKHTKLNGHRRSEPPKNTISEAKPKKKYESGLI